VKPNKLTNDHNMAHHAHFYEQLRWRSGQDER